ncbi:hypothetical protein IGW14_35380 [Streptomyces hygroscopicus subsp. hygroscopicus]|uniref:hypothetical protein n=1 Tax=Streptomyces hygroscopicus TaxID=1912 RepID=UPI001C65C77E|nr:hypothetical protein [Streptomyces hygroscopicus]MBW8093111.1 hypothetical protein [Streptomyces hygroscopicus subsp. hygroscopicus]
MGVVGEVVEFVDAVVLVVLRQLVVLRRRAGCGSGAEVRVPGGGNGQHGGAGEEGLLGGGGVAAVDAAHELVEGVGEVGFVLLAVVVVNGNGEAAAAGAGLVVERVASHAGGAERLAAGGAGRDGLLLSAG